MICHCGKPLHYSNPNIQNVVEQVIKSSGDEFVSIIIHTKGVKRTFRVQRHYMALHGIKAKELPTLGFKEI